MKLLKLYYYFFYKVYKLFKFIEPKSESVTILKIKSSTVLGAIEILVLGSFYLYSCVFLKKTANSLSLFLLIGGPMFVMLSDWLLLTRNDKWIKYVSEFDQWPPKRNNKGSLIVLIILAVIISNFAYSAHLFEQNRSAIYGTP